jgi:hypothetical protein
MECKLVFSRMDKPDFYYSLIENTLPRWLHLVEPPQ